MNHTKVIAAGGPLLRYSFLIIFCLCVFTPWGFAAPEHDLSSEKVLYAVGTAHLDTQWRWTIQTTIDDYIKKTLDDNFALFEQYPNYNFSFEGPFRYMLMKEYYPDRYNVLRGYVDQGRWRVAGTTLENGDMNVVSPESMIRQALIGNNFFEDEFGKRSTDIFLPDCFGFSYTMPTWGAHCGINGFSSQKLSWGGAVPAPFNVGVWKGPDGSSIIAALNPGAYVSDIRSDLSNDQGWLDRINATGDNYGVYADYMYFGTGDTGGAPSADSCSWLEQSIAGNGPITVVSAGSDDLYNDITPEQKAGLPVYDGELLMRIHGNGCYTSQAAMKRWNRQNELMADSAERVSVMADWLGAVDYPQETLDNAWVRFLWHTFHDDITGTSIPEAYHFSWNDEILSLNQFASILSNGVGGITQALDTQVDGAPIVVYNPLGIAREDVAEATVVYETEVPEYVRVFDGSVEVPSQILSRSTNSITLAFLADVPSVGFKVYDVRSSEQPSALDTGLGVSTSVLENSLYRVSINQAGDIASIYDKQNSRELLSAPCRLELLSDYSPVWPAWEIRYEDIQQTPYAYVGGPAEIEIVEDGPARVALEIKRTYGMDEVSTFIQKISLGTGAGGNQINVENRIDWRTAGTLLKASFPLTAANSHATYDLGMGTIQRPNNHSGLYEVPAQQWADITHSDSAFGVSILNDCRYGWDKPVDNLLRLTLLHTPSVEGSYSDQRTQDLGQHLLTYAIAPHGGDWTHGQIPQQAARLNQPLISFQSDKHAGSLGSEYSFAQISDSQIAVRAIKKAQRSGEIIVRFQELYGTDASNVRFSAGNGIMSAREVNGSEQNVGAANIVDGELEFSMTKYQPKTFALTLNSSSVTTDTVEARHVSLPYNLDAFSPDTNRSDGDFDGGLTYPAELMADTLEVTGVPFQMGSLLNGQSNAVSCTGQAVYLGTHSYDSIYVLAASRGGDVEGTFTVSGQPVTVCVQDYHEHVVDWGRESDAPYLKRDIVGWIGTHRHAPSGNQAYEFCNLFMYQIDLPAGTNSVVLPNNDDIVIFAMTMANAPAAKVRPAVELYDTLPYIPELAPKPETRTNLALNKPVSANGFFSGETPEQAVDGRTADNSKWCTGTGQLEPHWLIVDLQQVYDIDTFVVRHAGDGGETSDWNTSDYRIQTSPDGVSDWSDLVSVEGNYQNVSRHVIDPAPARYLRLYITKPTQGDDTAVRIYEFEVYGPCDGHWLEGDISGPDGVADCHVDLFDLQKLAQDWTMCNAPQDAECYDYWMLRYPDPEPIEATGDTTSSALPEESLVAYWKIREGSGLTLDDLSSFNESATLVGDPAPAWATGWFPQDTSNYSLYFDSSNYAVVAPDESLPSPNLYNLQTAMTISAWVRADDWNGNRRILQKGDHDNQYRLLAEWGDLVFDIYNVGRIETPLPTSGVWHHVAAVYDGAAMRLYVDGVQQAMMYASGQINLTSDPLYIGTKNDTAPGGDHYKGYLDDIRVYCVGLTEEQVRELAQRGQNVVPVILDITRRHDLPASIMGSSPLEAAVYDVNGDIVTYQWSEAGSSPFVLFEPGSMVADPEVTFSEPGDYTLQLAVDDGNNGVTTQSVQFTISAIDCSAIREMNFHITGDVNYDCNVDLDDLATLCQNWLISVDNLSAI